MAPSERYWVISPAANVVGDVPYGNVADVSDWPNWRLFEGYLPARLFFGTVEEWTSTVSRLESWMDFIWSDDSFPWVTRAAVDKLTTSGLTGFHFEPIRVVEIANTDLSQLNFDSLPALCRVVPISESEHPQIYKRADFLGVGAGGLVIEISDNFRTWLLKNRWANYDLQLKP